MRIDRIKFVSAMVRRDMTQKRLAELTGVSRVTVNGIANGRSCTADTAGRIAAALGVDVTELLEDN